VRLCFFFQAEDGIRDKLVTGVQTCALPISLRVAKKKAALSTCDLLLRGFLAGAFLAYATSLVMIVLSQGLPPIVGALLFPVGFRSEERRVGKECRWLLWRYLKA